MKITVKDAAGTGDAAGRLGSGVRLGTRELLRRFDLALLRFHVAHQRVRRQRNAHLRAGHLRDDRLWHVLQPCRRAPGRPRRPTPTGTSATHTAGYGTTATNSYGDTAYHATGSSYTTYTTPTGSTAYHSAYYGGAVVYPAYHPPTTVNYYSSGCYNCGGWDTAGAAAAGAAVGMVAGAAIANSNNQAAQANAYNAGVVAGATAATPVAGAERVLHDGRDLCGAARRRQRRQPERLHLLRQREQLVPALVWGQRRVLPRGAAAVLNLRGPRRAD